MQLKQIEHPTDYTNTPKYRVLKFNSLFILSYMHPFIYNFSFTDHGL